MATTRLMPLHIGKGRSVGTAIEAIIDYVANPEKTDSGRLITSWQCDSRVADSELPIERLAIPKSFLRRMNPKSSCTRRRNSSLMNRA